MTPWQLAKGGSEHSEQAALFCFCAKAEKLGFMQAFDPNAYVLNKSYERAFLPVPIPELAWYHAIPNGGNRGDNAKSRAIEGGKMKAEGVKSGVHDTFWPLARGPYSGLYIEMKKRDLKRSLNPTHGASEEQKEFGQFVVDNGFFAIVCYGWEEAAKYLQSYYEGNL
jgi:hypothetical protein